MNWNKNELKLKYFKKKKLIQLNKTYNTENIKIKTIPTINKTLKVHINDTKITLT